LRTISWLLWFPGHSANGAPQRSVRHRGKARHSPPCQDRARVAIERAAFPRSQRLGAPVTFVITVRNAGERTIPNLGDAEGLRRRCGPQPLDRRRVAAWHQRDRRHVNGWPAASSRDHDAALEGDPVAAGTHELSYLVGADVLRDTRTTSPGGGRPGERVTVRYASARPMPA
jgi:hypothetical protein